ncbi:MAG: hypothetical protein P9L91_10585, partial [Candidatus Zophobacter franzmannii]|nr:hypothetical protein [Candidatus Zophobacter franzmannii]
MKKLTLFALLILLITSVLADPLGITANIPDDDQGFWSGQRAVQGRPELNIAQSGISNTNNERWEEVSRIDFNEYLEAGKYLGVEYNPWSFQFNRVSNQSFVNNNAETAIARAPIWVQSQLRYTFSQLTNARQNVWATLILDTVSPYIDEVCYSIANSGPGYLARQDIYPEVMIENAELMYTYADEFQFVDIVEHGSEASGDWYTTTRYRKMDEFGIARWVEVDRDIHYMYNVHPKFTDEIPNYIDPEQSESNTSHANNFAAPPAGRFWREYLYYHNDTGYPQLRSMLANCQYVIGSPVSSENVINQLNSWINGSMSFTSDNERPHQPIRIYDKHIGRCGEYQDLRGAVARIALVPVKGINCISGDHVWNEFWDERWIHWDGAIDNPLLYENGWGRHYGSIFEQRSDGKFIPVSDRYSDGHATLNIWAVDVDNRPIDGASVYLRVDIDGEPYFDNIGVTDDNGLCVFIVGEDRKYYARVNSVIQNMPSSGYDLLVENASNNAVYDFTFQSTQAMSVPEVTDIPIPDGTGSLYKVVADFSSDSSLIIGNSVFDDASGGKNYEPDSNNGAIDFYMTDSINYAAAMSGLPFSAFNSFTDTQNGSVEFLTNNTDYWYSLLFNRHNVSNPKHVQGSFIVYTTDADYLNGTLDVSVADMYGNPVSGTTVVLRPNNLSFEVTGDATSLTVPQGTYDIYCYPSASQPNYLPTYVQGYSITAGETAVLEFTLLENANPAGRVIAIDEGTQVRLTWDNTSVNTRDLDHYSVYRGEANSDMTIN